MRSTRCRSLSPLVLAPAVPRSRPPPASAAEPAAGLHLALQRQGPHRLEGPRRRQRPLEGRGRRHRLRRPERGDRRQDPLDARRSTRDFVLRARVAHQGDALRQPERPDHPLRRHAQEGARRQGDQALGARLRLRHLPARLDEVAGQHLVLADRLRRGLRLPHGREDAARGARRASRRRPTRTRTSASGTRSRSR